MQRLYSDIPPAEITRQREAMRLSREDFARRLGVAYVTVYKWEQPGGRMPLVAEVALRTVRKERAEELAALADKVRMQVGGGHEA